MSSDHAPPTSEWQAEYEFWTKIIEDEVARLRWNKGFEPLDAHLYELCAEDGTSEFVGSTRICGREFQCRVYPAHDANDRPTLYLEVRVAARKHT